MYGAEFLRTHPTYFHVVFTLPHALNPLIRVNPRELYALLFQAAAATLLTFAGDPKHLGGEPGITMALHTWGQNLTEHVHVHCVVSGGGLSADASRWMATRRHGFLFPVLAMSKVFRGKYLAVPARMHKRGRLRFTGRCAKLADSATWQSLLTTLQPPSLPTATGTSMLSKADGDRERGRGHPGTCPRACRERPIVGDTVEQGDIHATSVSCHARRRVILALRIVQQRGCGERDASNAYAHGNSERQPHAYAYGDIQLDAYSYDHQHPYCHLAGAHQYRISLRLLS
jgi:hypothetical protein